MRASMTAFVAVACCAMCRADFTTIDRIAVVVAGHPIKTSDIDRDIRATEFINGEPLDLGAEAKKQAAQRLIDQQIIRNELQVGGYQRPDASEAASDLDQIRKERYRGSEARMHQALARYGLTEDELRARLLWQLTVLKFIDQRFRPGVLVSDQDIQTYYNQHRAELAKDNGGHTSLEALTPKIREAITADQINQQFFAWLDQQRKDVGVTFIPGVLE